MQIVKVTKTVSDKTAGSILHQMGLWEYAGDFNGAMVGIAAGADSVALSIVDSADDTQALAILNGMETVTCTDSGLTVTVDVGTHLVSDATLLVAHATELKTIMVSLVLDDITGALEAYAFEKTTGEYGATPAGKTFIHDLKEYTLIALGSSLTEIASLL